MIRRGPHNLDHEPTVSRSSSCAFEVRSMHVAALPCRSRVGTQPGIIGRADDCMISCLHPMGDRAARR